MAPSSTSRRGLSTLVARGVSIAESPAGWSLLGSAMTDALPKPPTSRLRTWAKRLLVVLLTLVAIGVAAGVALNKPRPVGTPSPEADALARRVEEAVRADRWRATGAVRWTFFGHEHLWDKERGFIQVQAGSLRVLLRTADQTGVAFRDGQALRGEELRDALDKAWGFFCNDSFWLNPAVKLFDEGTTRSIVEVEGEQALLIEYGSGGVTPGDAYLWLLSPDGTPREWRMWVGILPIGGVSTPWQGWVALETGARVSTQHGDGLLGFRLGDVRGAETLSVLVGSEDPFAQLLR